MFRAEASARNVTGTVVWDGKGVLFVDYLPCGSVVTGQYFDDLIQKIRDAIKSKRSGKLRHGVLLLQANTTSHKAASTQATIRVTGFQIFEHLPRPIHLTWPPSNYNLLRRKDLAKPSTGFKLNISAKKRLEILHY